MTISHDDYRKARVGDIVAICDISGDEFVRAADGSTFCRNGDTGNYVAMSQADFDAAVNVVMDNNDAAARMWDADDARASAQVAAVEALEAEYKRRELVSVLDVALCVLEASDTPGADYAAKRIRAALANAR